MVYVILGETASGKTDIALEICRKLHIPLISADAYSVYRGFDIGSAKPSKEELQGIEHYFIDYLDFGESMSVYEFQKEGRKLLDRFKSEGRDCVVAGGTFLYVRALLFPLNFPEDQAPHPEVIEDIEAMKEELLELDPEASKTVDMNNPRRVERALALARTGTTRTQLVKEFVNYPLYPSIFIRIETDPKKLAERIALRIKKMMESGLVEETQRLMSLAPSFAPTFRGIGFKEICDRLLEGSSLDGVEEQIAIDTRQYARRQRTYLRHQFPFCVTLPRERIVDLVIENSLRRGDAVRKTELENPMPLVPSMSAEYTPWIDRLYRDGVRQIAIYVSDRGMLNDFVDSVHSRSPLMQILVFDDLEIKKGKLPPFSYALPTPDGVRLDQKIVDYIAEKNIPTRSVEELNLPAPGKNELEVDG